MARAFEHPGLHQAAGCAVSLKDVADLGDHLLWREDLFARPARDGPHLAQCSHLPGRPSATTMSAVPWVQRIGGLGVTFTIPDQLQNLPDSALRMPRVPGAIPGQLDDGVMSPGKPSSPMTDFNTSSTSMSSRSGLSRWVDAQ